MPSWRPTFQLKISRAEGCICIDCVQRSPLTWAGCSESQLVVVVVVWWWWGVSMETKETLQPQAAVQYVH